jgi:peptide/nickel transport system substrate-binding protein
MVLVALLLAGCNPGANAVPEVPPTEQPAAAAPTAVPEAPPTEEPVAAAPTEVPTPAGPKRGGELRVALEEDMTNTDPHFEQAYFGLVVFEQVYEGLLTRGYDMSLQPGLAESWEMPDPQTYIFHLRRVKFHNGGVVPMTSSTPSTASTTPKSVQIGGWLASVADQALGAIPCGHFPA